MLKGIDPLLGPELLMILRTMGHGDEIAIVDGNYPADSDAQRLVRMDGHSASSIVEAILSVMPIDDFVSQAVFRPAANGDPKRMEAIFSEFEGILLKYEPKQKIIPLVGADFYNRVKGCFAIVATGERRLYGNLILRKGVIYPT
jgi:L-fucose mutarotase